MSEIIELEFSRKYNREHASKYLRKHQETTTRRLSNWRDMQLARKALQLAGNPGLVLDLPCGAGRFWPVLTEQPNRVIMAADHSLDMLQVARNAQAEELLARIKLFQTSAFDIGLEDNAVDCIFCMRLLHHIADAQHRLTMLREFHRVTRDTVIVSLWMDGNFKAWKRKRLERKRQALCVTPTNQNRFIINKALIESEFKQVGFDVIGRHDFLPGYAMWRVYTLRKLS